MVYQFSYKNQCLDVVVQEAATISYYVFFFYLKLTSELYEEHGVVQQSPLSMFKLLKICSLFIFYYEMRFGGLCFVPPSS